MATLAITYSELRRYIGRFLGYSRSTSDINAEKAWKTDVDDVIRSGMREFYFYRAAEGVEPGHVWSFLQKSGSLSVTAGDREITMPSDFSRMVDGFTYGYGTNKTSLAAIGSREVLSLYANSDVSGTPLYYAIQASSSGTAYVATIYPKAAADVTFSYRYAFDAPAVDSGSTSPLGGALHAETILESCLAAAEKQMNPEKGPGIHHLRFVECLKASLTSDKQYNTAGAEEGAWPLDEVDGTVTDLTINKVYLMRLIGRKMGHGENDGAWNHKQASEVSEVLRQGMRGFYSPVIAPGETNVHSWSFLEPVGYLAFEAGKDTYDLPEDFSMMNGPMTYQPGAAVLYPPVNIVGEAMVRRYMQSSGYTGRPTIGAVRVKDLSVEEGTRYELIVQPTPDQDYPVIFPYRANPMLVSKKTDLPLGGQAHHQTLIESCLYAADSFMGEQSLHQGKFMECLRASVSYDKEASSPPHLGYNGDGSDQYGSNRDWHDMDENLVGYYNSDGVEYST